ncbi:MAG: glycine zipper 2TM domain-containing protein [Ramlibacter sp.]|nr:glycine zipper 2TM domain-containing protein [Ramlibacter sp.]
MRATTRHLFAASAVVLSAALAACGTYDPYGPNNYPVSSTSTYSYGTQPYGSYPSQPVAAVEYGRVLNVSMVSAGTGPAPGRSAAGGVIGAIVGGLLGNQIGSGGGRAAATVLGATAGAVVGSQAAGRTAPYNAAYPVYRVTVQTDQGHVRTYDVNATGDLRPGDRVRIENGIIYLA